MSGHINRTLLAATTRNSLAPFLYQTCTLSNSFPRLLRSHSQAYSTSSSKTPDDQSQIESHKSPQNDTSADTPLDSQHQTQHENAPTPRRSYLQQRASKVSTHQPSLTKLKPLAMTRGEKEAFSDLLEQLVAVQKDSATTKKQNAEMSEEDKNDMVQISEIFDEVLRDIQKRKKRVAASKNSEGHPLVDTEIQDTPQNIELQIRLRKSEYSNADISELLESKQISTEQGIELIVKKEARSIERALRAAINEGKGDTGVWDICRERIFSILQHLGDDHLAKAIGLGLEKRQAADSPTNANETSQLEVPSSIPVEPIVTALYPKMLLVAFRLLNLHFPNSPLISQFRSTIKSHGRASAVVGSSTGLYNELIYFYWRGCHDIPGVVSLLQEMEVTGVEPNRRTCGLLTGIVNQRDWDLKQHWKRMRDEQRGSQREPWWDLAPNRKAIRELVGPEGWMHRLEQRMEKNAQSSR
ncbi:hypothetical protein BDV28DRAFT_42140 [Aspergillus coremiiformis]|uniref:Mtf2-like C-terminal domain-containing protein n=1 Tax=Aspergillus coremiiformis TaxID=138285 RepID=A0A5N6ZIX3_9EURO|nr:hypothetical protein BDV28DRAFT_42140 [Aspergillus coremiiformis]